MGELSEILGAMRSGAMLLVAAPLVIIAVLLVRNSIEKRASAVLGLLLLAIAWSVMPHIIAADAGQALRLQQSFFPFSGSLFFGPLLWLHCHLLLSDKPVGRSVWLLVPGLAQLGYYAACFLLLDAAAKAEWFSTVHQPIVLPAEALGACALLVLAAAKAGAMLKEYRRFLPQTQSDIDTLDPVWIERMVRVILPVMAAFAGLQILSGLRGATTPADTYPILLALAVMVLWLSVDAVMRLRRRFPRLPQSPGEPKSRRAGLQVALDDVLFKQTGPQHREEVDAVIALLKADGSFRVPHLTLGDVACRLGVEEEYLSQAFNRGSGRSFHLAVNRLRIDYACQLLKASDDIEAVAAEAGFDSARTFDKLFRRKMKIGPREYAHRRSHEAGRPVLSPLPVAPHATKRHRAAVDRNPMHAG